MEKSGEVKSYKYFGSHFKEVPTTPADSYVPTEEDIFIFVGDDYQRLIFGDPIVFKDEEKESLKEFLNY